MKNAEQLLNDICLESSFFIDSIDSKSLYIILGYNGFTIAL